MENVGIIFGGQSVEHEISILTMLDCYKNIRGKKYLIYVSKEGLFYLADLKIAAKYKNPKKYYKKIVFINGGIKTKFKKIRLDYTFIMMHGINGEDGCAYSLCSMHNIKVIGSENIISGIALRKDLFKKICDVPTLDFVYADENLKIDKYPKIVKPVDLGSSIGINIAYNDLEYKKALNEAKKYSKKIIVEDYLENAREFNCAVCFDIISDVYEVTNGFLSFEKKYKDNHQNNIIDDEIKGLVKQYSRKIYDLGFSGVIRIDYLYKDNILYLNEVNTIPGTLSMHMFSFNIFDYLVKKTMQEYQNIVLREIETDILDLNSKK